MTRPASAVAPPIGRAAPMPRRAPAPRRAPTPRRAPARHPRRISGPAHPARAARPVRAAARVVPRPAGAVLDRLIRGRLWIGLLAFSLIGIVAMQMVVLKLNTDVGRTLTHEATLQRENAQLGIEDSMYSAETRVAPLAAGAGMTLAPPGSVHFVQAVQADISRAASVLSQPIQAHAEAASAASTEVGEATSSSSTSEASGSTPTSDEATASAATTGDEATAGTATTAESSGTSETGGSSEALESSSTSTGG
jgi:hypothetical protein